MSDAPRPIPEILAELQAAVDEVSAERRRYGYIAETIRVNALRHGATTEQVEDFIHGRTSFVNWMADIVQRQSEAQAAALAALRERADEVETANVLLEVELHRIHEAIKMKGGTEHSPTEDAYNAACAAIVKHKARADEAEAELSALRAERDALVEATEFARNRLEVIADERWNGDARDFKRLLVGVFAEFSAAIARAKGE